MPNSKNYTPSQISIYIGIITGIVSFLLVLIIKQNILFALLSLMLVFATCFLTSKYFIELFIYRRVKLLYKFIHQTKASKREEFFQKNILPQQSLDEVGEEVLKWADHRKTEMEILEKNEAFRKEFLQNLAHEFKTPAFAIQGYLETLIEGASENVEVNKKFLSNAHKNTERLIHLISDLDEITRLESGKQQLHLQDFVIQELINDVFESLSLKMSLKNIRCQVKKGCEQPVFVNADKEKIRQVLINLIDNAAKYGSEDGKIEASIYQTDEKTVLIEITDDGIGIAEEHLPRIFERFYRTDYGRSRNIGGTGLGLAICKHIIEAHGQFIQARSTPGIGTTFGFTLKTA